jgi:thioesterase domain-containing protein
VGWSFGGLIVFEMACRMRNSGHEVGFLGIFDASVPDVRTAGDEPDYTDVIHDNASILARRAGAAFDIPAAELRALPHAAQTERVFRRLSAQGALSPESTLERFGISQEMDLDRRRVLRHYVPNHYDRQIDLFVAEETERRSRAGHGRQSRRRRDLTFGWAPYAHGGIRRWIIPGAAHYNFLSEPHAAILAARVARRLRQRSATRTDTHITRHEPSVC